MALTGEQTTLVAQLQRSQIDTLDYLAFWRTFDLAMDAAFSGKNAQALRNDAKLVDMERWSDGWPVKRLAAEEPRLEPVASSKAEPAPTMMPVPRKRR